MGTRIHVSQSTEFCLSEFDCADKLDTYFTSPEFGSTMSTEVSTASKSFPVNTSSWCNMSLSQRSFAGVITCLQNPLEGTQQVAALFKPAFAQFG